MKKIIAALLSLPFIILTSCTNETGLLWKIEHKDLESPSYLFGTIHLLCQEDLMDFMVVDSVIAEVDKVVFELDFSDPEFNQKMIDGGNSEKFQLKSHLNDQQKKVLDAYFNQNFGMGISQLDNIRPYTLTVMSLQDMVGCTQLSSIDLILFEKAQLRSLPVVGLETPEFQFSIFDKIPVEVQISELVNMVTDPDSVKIDFKNLVTQYNDQNIEGLYDSFVESPYHNYQNEFLDNRNKAWIPKIEKIMKNESIFIAVGAMHLVGENGVIELLRQQGYTVTALKND